MDRRDFLRRVRRALRRRARRESRSPFARRARADGASRLQGAGLRVPVRRHRRQQRARSRSTPRAMRSTPPCAARTRASRSRKPSCCRSRRRNVGTPFGLHPALDGDPSAVRERQARAARQRRNADAADDPGAVRGRRAAGEPLLAFGPADAVADVATRTAPSRTGWGGRLADAMAPLSGGTLSRDHVDRGRHALRHRRDDATARRSRRPAASV